MPLNEMCMKGDWNERLEKVVPDVKATSPFPFPR